MGYKLKYTINHADQFSGLWYCIGLGVGLIAFVGIILITCFKINIVGISPFGDCVSKYGFYCFGCGGTRAVAALLKGKLLLSLYYHPFVLYVVVIYFCYMLSYTLRIVSHGRIKSMQFRPGYFYLAMIIIIGQCVIKNILLWRYGFIL